MTLKFLQVDRKDALKTFLVKKLESLGEKVWWVDVREWEGGVGRGGRRRREEGVGGGREEVCIWEGKGVREKCLV